MERNFQIFAICKQTLNAYLGADQWILLLFLVVVQCFYWQTRHAGYVTDFTGLLARLESASFSDTFHSLGYPGMEQVLRMIQYAFYHWFGAFGLHWYLLFTLVHTLNGWLLYKLLRRLFERYELVQAWSIAAVGALLFLISPYQTEVLVWRVCLNYLSAGFFTLLALNQCILYLESARNKHLYWSLVWMFLGLFSFELALSGPFIIVGLAVLFHLMPKAGEKGLNRLIISAAHLMLLPLYFFARKVILGDWVGYYGADVHLNFDLKIIIGNIYKYLSKLWLFLRYWEHPTKEPVFLSFEQSNVLWTLSLVAILFYALLFIFFKRIPPKLNLARLY